MSVFDYDTMTGIYDPVTKTTGSTGTIHTDLLTGEQWEIVEQRTHRSGNTPISSRIYRCPGDPRYWLVITWPGRVSDTPYVGTLAEMRNTRNSFGG